MKPDHQPSAPTPALIDIREISRLTAAGLDVKDIPGYKPFVVIDRDQTIVSIEKKRLPDHIIQDVKLDELDSFCAYVKQFATATTRIFATTNDQGASFKAVLDYHEGGRDGAARWAQHTARFTPAYSPEFAAWLAVNKKEQTQQGFLDHLRRWGFTIRNLTDADLIEIASNLEFKTAGQFSSKIERTKGGKSLVWNEDVQGGGTVRGQQVPVPDALTMKMPVFVNGREYTVDADILYRVNNGGLKIIVELKRDHVFVRDAVQDLVADVKAGTDIEPFIGAI